MASKVTDRIARQLSLPTKGLFGWITFHLLKRKNSGLEKVAAKLSAIEPHHHVLELGFGPGYGIMHAHDYVKDGPGKVYGVELSPYMLEKASALLHKPIQAGKVELVSGDVMNLLYEADTFHRVFHVNCFYFWPCLETSSREILRVVKPGGLMVTALSLQGLQQAGARGLLKYGRIDHTRYMEVLEQTGWEGVTLQHYSKGPAKFEAIFARRPEDQQ
ncbi:hypothetical protein ACOMHN_026497 [Nucella lapillus]